MSAEDETAQPETPAPASGTFTPPVEPREMKNDPRAMRALAHPVRMALMEELAVAGELTATEASDLVGESPANCSFHLRQLAKYGFVEESGTGQGRNRPWRLTTVAMNLDVVGAESEPEAAVAMEVLTAIFVDRAIGRLRNWFQTQSGYPREWRRASMSKQTLWWVTPEELEGLNAEITEIAWKYFDRSTDPALRPEGALPIEFLGFAYPVQAPARTEPADGSGAPVGD